TAERVVAGAGCASRFFRAGAREHRAEAGKRAFPTVPCSRHRGRFLYAHGALSRARAATMHAAQGWPGLPRCTMPLPPSDRPFGVRFGRAASRPMPHPILVVVLCLVLAVLGCSPNGAGPGRVTVSGSSSGAEADVLATQLARFRKLHPGIEVVVIPAPETADERHQLYVQWSNAGVGEPDVLQLDVVWLQEFAAAGWLLPADVALDDFFPAARAATLYQGRSYAVPWFVDVG